MSRYPCLLLLALGCAGNDAPTTDAERLVRQYILNNAKDPKGVEFVKFGPNMTKADLAVLEKEAGADLKLSGHDALVRVVYKSELIADPIWGWKKHNDLQCDQIFVVSGGKVEPHHPGQMTRGDEWVKFIRKDLAKRYPNIKVP